MTNIFDVIAHYQVGYEVIEERNFTAAEKARVESAEIVEGSYGLSVCFHLVGNKGVSYIQLDTTSKLNVGDSFDIENSIIRTLKKPGETKLSYRALEKE